MKIKLICIVTALVIVTSSVLGVAAADIDMSTRCVTIEGRIENGVKGTRYLAKVFNPGVKENPNSYEVTQWYSYLHQGVLETDGVYQFTYLLPENAASGKYEVEVVTETAITQTDVFYYFTDAYGDEVVQAMTTPVGESDESKLVKLMADLENQDIRKAVNADFTLYDALTEKKKAAAVLLKKGTIATRKEFKPYFAGVCAASAISEAAADEVASILQAVCEETGLAQLSTYKKYAEGSSAIDSLMVASGAVDADGLAERLSYYIIKEELSKIENWQRVQPTLIQYNDVLGIDFSKYEASDYQYDIVNTFLKSEYKTLAEISEAFVTAIEKNASGNDTNTKVNTSTGSGGGGGKNTTTVIGKKTSASIGETPSVPEVRFADVPENHWARSYIETLVQNGVVSGDENGHINPDHCITREEFVKIAVVALQVSKAQNYVPFRDVSEGAWSSTYIQSARENGLVAGTEDGDFMPQAPVSRQDMFVILGRYLVGAENVPDASFGFADEKDADVYARPYIAYMAQKGLLKGFSDGTMRPRNQCTRAEAFAILCRVLEFNRTGEQK